VCRWRGASGAGARAPSPYRAPLRRQAAEGAVFVGKFYNI